LSLELENLNCEKEEEIRNIEQKLNDFHEKNLIKKISEL